MELQRRGTREDVRGLFPDVSWQVCVKSAEFCIMLCQEYFGLILTDLGTHRPELMKSVDGHGSCSLTALLLFRVLGSDDL
jgi:hypothetical protein